jgi:hypothetical protein
MRNTLFTKIGLSAAAFLLTAGLAGAQTQQGDRGGLMHCFAFTPIANATNADWQAFYKATEAMPGKIQGVRRVWYGKLLRPLAQFNPDAESRKRLTGGEEMAKGEVRRAMREYGVCMEMDNEQALKQYAGSPYHKEWMQAYEKVRQPGTTTFDIVMEPRK